MQILMSIKQELMSVMRVQSAVTQMEDMSASVEMDSQEMELIAMVSTTIIIMAIAFFWLLSV